MGDCRSERKFPSFEELELGFGLMILYTSIPDYKRVLSAVIPTPKLVSLAPPVPSGRPKPSKGHKQTSHLGFRGLGFSKT